jgi:hypothetical protein
MPLGFADTNIDLSASQHGSPLLAAIREYERVFLKNLYRCVNEMILSLLWFGLIAAISNISGKAYVQTCEQALSSCQKCIEEHHVRCRAYTIAWFRCSHVLLVGT